jgi:hypothetical protein
MRLENCNNLVDFSPTLGLPDDLDKSKAVNYVRDGQHRQIGSG